MNELEKEIKKLTLVVALYKWPCAHLSVPLLMQLWLCIMVM
jgi:hypothetical protein